MPPVPPTPDPVTCTLEQALAVAIFWSDRAAVCASMLGLTGTQARIVESHDALNAALHRVNNPPAP